VAVVYVDHLYGDVFKYNDRQIFYFVALARCGL